jgi:uncharacterized protein with NRDE domain
MYAYSKIDVDSVDRCEPGTTFLGPVDEHDDLKGSWFLVGPEGRFAILTNVRRPFSLLSHLDNPLLFSYVFKLISLSCFLFFLVSVHHHQAHIAASIDSRENYVYEVVLNLGGSNAADKDSDSTVFTALLTTLPLIFDKSTAPLLFPTVFLWLLGTILKRVPYKISRGYIVTSFLNSTLTADEFIKQFCRYMKGLDYDGFNLVLSDGVDVHHITNRANGISPQVYTEDDSGGTVYCTKLEKGHLYGVSNAGLDTPWDKLVRGKNGFDDRLRQAGCRGNTIYGKAPIATGTRDEVAEGIIYDVLADTTACEPANTGCSREIEKGLARINVPPVEFKNPTTKLMDKYGTRTSIVMMQGWEECSDENDHWGDVAVWEKDWIEDGEHEVKVFKKGDAERGKNSRR